ncbi:MAG: 16S rRNA (guanine(966)-N(2))-methyltransferase RsmD [Deltaproteobacteria bacterium]|nr:16S rRNA (guanine(966)-N(2))-methyltransferase RsmD [Deltaproteobacteria bacterium]
MRVSAGEFKGKKLIPIKGKSIRPVSNKIKAAIFNILGSYIKGKKILDLFAGTGAFGIEAISSGAEFCVFMDNSKYSLSIINKNINLCLLQDKTEIIKKDIIKSYTLINYSEYPFDIIFLDPPYKANAMVSTIEKISKTVLENSKVIIVAEHSIKTKLPKIITPFILYDARRYGNTAVSFFSSGINKPYFT